MSYELIYWGILIGFGLIFLALIWLIGFGEFSYLSAGLIRGLYNSFALIYDLKWLSSEAYRSKTRQESLFLEPLRRAYKSDQHRHVDLACGTGRLSLILLSAEWYRGSVEAIDFSRGMLAKFRSKLADIPKLDRSRLSITELDLKDWQAMPESFDSISLLEVGEFLPFFTELISKVGKALKPNGLFLLTKPPEFMAWAYPGRAQTNQDLMELLTQEGFHQVKIHPWTSRYDVVWAWKIS
ncbi:MAG: class I SAM-dependent methyltransferase [Candidatus Caenarcaniphilales bacterium]|nr:class I SAM-dependent methyltransferase [Candidatus Caenarcaniphilales bacterium]